MSADNQSLGQHPPHPGQMFGDRIIFPPPFLFCEGVAIGFGFGRMDTYDLMSIRRIGNNPIPVPVFKFY